VKETLDLVGLPNMGDRYPSELSGGQQQRVAFGRAISYDPSLLLMDEPLSNLDLKLRKEMRQVILDILEKIDVTTVYVTHDQEEAFELSDNIAIFRDGKKVQEGDPRTIYNYPKSSFVANFIGEANIIETDTLISRNENLAVLSISGGDTTVTATYTDKNALEDPVVVIRPQDILIQKAENEGVSGRDPLHETNDVFGSISQGIAKEKNQFTGYVEKVIYRGGVNLITVKNENFSLVVESHEDTWSENDTVTLTIPTDRAIVTFREMV
jgi:ABC-type Fe3+/spermidine/putrescine transport system ATPase subunit